MMQGLLRAGCGATALFLAGCAVTTQPLSKDDVAQRVIADRARMFADQEPIRGPLTFPDAAARAVKYNLDYRLKQMETALQLGLTDLSRWDLLPKLMVNAGYSARNNDLATQSFTLDRNTGSVTQPSGSIYSGSQERKHGMAGAELSWNLLDFGVSYYRAKQQSDQRLIAEERGRRVAQNIIQDTHTAYWRALGAQRLLSQVESTMKRAEGALQRARQIEQQGLMPQAQALAYQRALLDATTMLAFRRQDLELAKLELTSLMNLAPGSNFTLADERETAMPAAPSDIQRLEDMALKQRPELVEEDYKARISAAETKKQFWSLFPGIGVNLGGNLDTNNYLLHKSWVEGGLRLGMNLLKLASLPAQNRANEAQAKVDETRRLSQGMAIMTQVRVAAMRYGLALTELTQVEESARVDQRLLNYARAAQTTRVDSELEVIRNEARSVLSAYQRHVAYSNAQAAWARLYNSVGYDVIGIDSNQSVSQLSSVIERAMNTWRTVTFGTAAIDTGFNLAAVQITIDNVTDPALQASVKAGIVEAFQRYGVTTTDQPGAHRVIARMETEASQNGIRRANYQMTIFRPNGTIAGRTRFTSVVPGEVTPGAMMALTQSAIDANSQALVDWLQVPSSTIANAPRQAPAQPAVTAETAPSQGYPVQAAPVAATVAAPAVMPASRPAVAPRASQSGGAVYRPSMQVQ